MLDETRISEIAAELDVARRDRAQVPLITPRNPGMDVEDAYRIQGLWADGQLAAGKKIVGRKFGLTSKVMQVATGITEPDYGVIFDDMVYVSGDTIPFDAFNTLRVEVELAFVLAKPLTGAGLTVDDVLAATEYIVPALEILSSRIDLEGRTIVDTISDNAAMGAMVLGDTHTDPAGVDLPWVSAILRRNGDIEESGVAAAVLDHPATGVAWLAGKLAQHGASLAAGETILAGSFTRPIWIERGDELLADYKELGTIACRFA